jgi:hypothetical protein
VAGFDAWLEQLPPWGTYLIILVLSAIVYQTVFAPKLSLPVWKKALVYLFLALGCGLIYLFQILGFPMIQILLITTVLIFVTGIRLAFSRRKEKK